MRTHTRRTMRVPTTLVIAALVALVACEPADPRRTVAEEFIDRLFVVIDQQAARELATGLAVDKLDEEIRLTEGQRIDDGTRKPHVAYDFIEGRGAEGGDTAAFVYRLRIQPDGTDAFEKRVVLTLRKVEGDWRVANYALESAA
jgi:hypothetical protein